MALGASLLLLLLAQYAATNGPVFAAGPVEGECTPLAKIETTVVPEDGQLRVVVKAGTGALTSVQIGTSTQPPRNAVLDVPGGPAGIRGPASLPVPAGAGDFTFMLRPASAGEAVLVPLIAADACGPRQTVVGGGPHAFGGAARTTVRGDVEALDATIDLSASMTDSPDPVVQFGSLTYSVTVGNSPGASTPATGVTARLSVIADGLGTTVAVVSTTCPGIISGEFCTLPDVAPGGMTAYDMVLSPLVNGPLNNTVSIDATQTDFNPGNNTNTTTTTVTPSALPDLGVTASDSPDPVAAGQDLTYTFTVTNYGPAAAPDPQIRLNLPPAVNFVGHTFPGICTGDPATSPVICQLGNQPVGIPVPYTLTARPTAVGPLALSGDVSPGTTDPNPGNNAFSLSTSVTAATSGADLGVLASDSPDPVTTGQTLTYTFTVTNNGPEPVIDPTILINVPSTIAIVGHTFPGICSGSPAAPPITCQLGNQPVGLAVSYTLAVKPTVAGPLAVTGSLQATSSDWNPANNAFSLATTVQGATLSPQIRKVTINGGARTTTAVNINVTLDVSSEGGNVTEMDLSSDGTTWHGWRAFSPAFTWDLPPGDGPKTLHVRVRNAASAVSQTATSTITLDTSVDPTYSVSINRGAVWTNSIDVTLTIGASPGTSQMQVSNDGGFADAQWEPYASSKPWSLSRYGDTTISRVVFVRFKTTGGSLAQQVTDEIILDEVAPTGSVRLAGPSAPSADARAMSVTLELTASDDRSGVGSMRLSGHPSFAGAAWEPFGATRTWSTGGTVYVQFRDNAGNVSETYSAASGEIGCSPRAPVVLTSSMQPDGRLRVIVAPGAGSLLSIRFGTDARPVTNATVDVTGIQTGITGQTPPIALAPGTTSAELLIRRITPGAAMTVPLVIRDGCGDWETFVGAGAGAR